MNWSIPRDIWVTAYKWSASVPHVPSKPRTTQTRHQNRTVLFTSVLGQRWPKLLPVSLHYWLNLRLWHCGQILTGSLSKSEHTGLFYCLQDKPAVVHHHYKLRKIYISQNPTNGQFHKSTCASVWIHDWNNLVSDIKRGFLSINQKRPLFCQSTCS